MRLYQRPFYYWFLRMTVMSITRDALLHLLALLFPPVCLGCGRVEGITALPMGVCSRCHSLLDGLHSRESATDLARPEALDGVYSVWYYRPPVDAVIRALKYGRLEFLGRELAGALHCKWREEEVLQEVDMVVPIPLHWRRQLARGYNQAESLARPLAAHIEHPLVRALRRKRSTRPQTGLGRQERQENVGAAFAARRLGRLPVLGRRILLVDDVVTTGATLASAAAALRRAGADSVVALTAARREMTSGM